jgi:amino acid transporter
MVDSESKPSLTKQVKTLVIGKGRSPYERGLFHKLSLIAFFAWVGLGADGLSSSCYGPEEAFRALAGHHYLGIFVALGSALTVFAISASYFQIVEIFPTGGGGYLVASKLLSPGLGMLSGSALLIDYVLTITISIASGTDALFSFLPPQWYEHKLAFAIAGVVILTVLNLRGVKESVVPLVPIFLMFVVTHAFIIGYAVITHLMKFPQVASAIKVDVQSAHAEIGLAGMIFLILRSYSMGAGTYTGIEAVSNGLPILREPKVQTAKRTMLYMSASLAITVLGLMIAYLLYRVEPVSGKTLNAVLFERATAGWAGYKGHVFVLVTLFSEATLLFVAAQTGFLDGPRVLANMALDRWVPTKFSSLSDRFVAQNGILIMGGAAFLMMLFTRGSVRFLVVLYSINVFITFALSQLGMVRHWWISRAETKKWKSKLLINGVGLMLTLFILVSVIILKFQEGGWITLLVTFGLVAALTVIKAHYNHTGRILRRLNALVEAVDSDHAPAVPGAVQKGKLPQEPDLRAKTAVLLVSGFNGLGLHTLFSVINTFEGAFKNFIFLGIGVIDAGNFKGKAEIERLRTHIGSELDRYVKYMQGQGYYAERYSSIGVDAVEEISHIAPKIKERFPNAIFFGGQLIFPKESLLARWLHNYTAFAVQRILYYQGIPVVIMPIRV